MDGSKNEEPPKVKINLVDIESGPKEEAIRVCTRMRPLFEKEINAGHIKAWKMQETDMLLVVEPPSMQEMLNARDPKKANKKDDKKKIVEKTEGQKAVIQRHYAFDRCFDDHVGNEEVYKILARDIVLDTFKGINGCILAYGQTGSGKTHSVMGVPVDPGMLPRSLAEFFEVIENPSILNENKNGSSSMESDNETKEFLMRVTYLEVYMERVNDLLQEGPRGGAVENLDVKEDPKRGFVVIGIQEETVTSIDEVMLLVAKAEQRRHIAQTNFNETSSRSHTIFTVLLESNQIISDGTSVNKRGELKIVDLAGNERAGRAAEGVENAKTVLEEGKAINKSLFVLSEVISKLSKRAQAIASGDEKKLKKIQEDLIFIPWRDSKLTRILSKSLGGNCRASVIVAVHPSHLYLDTSFSTLRFALKCKTIKKKIEVNFLSPEQSVIMQQKELIAKLQNQLKHLATTKNLDLDYPMSDRKYPSSRKADDDEKVVALKRELEEKVEKFQNFILKSEFHAQNNTNYRTLRSIEANTENSLKYSMAISGNMQNELNWLRSFGTQEYDSKWDGVEKYEEQNEEEKINITKAMNYLKNKSPYERTSSGESEASTENSEKIEDSISMNYYDELEELEKLEYSVLNKVHQTDKSGGAINKTTPTEYDDLNKLIDSKEHMHHEDTVDGDGKKKDKNKKKNAKVSLNISGKNFGSLKKTDKLKSRAKTIKLTKGKKIKGKKDLSEKSDILRKLQGDESIDQELKSMSKDGGLKEENKKEDGEEDIVKEGEEKEKTGGIESKEEGTSKEQQVAQDGTTLKQKEQDTNEVQRTSIITNLKQKIVEDLKKKKKIYDRNVELNKQIKFVMKLMQKVGLSSVLTGVVPAGRNVEQVLQLRESLKNKLKLTGKKREPKLISDISIKGKDSKENSVTVEKEDAFKTDEDMLHSYLDYTTNDGNTTENVTTLSHVFINEMFYSFILKLHQKEAQDESLKQIENEMIQDKGHLDATNHSLEEILGTQITSEVQKIEGTNVNVLNSNKATPRNSKNNKSTTLGNNTNRMKNNTGNNANSALMKKEEKGKNTIESILNLLTPWEQKILALLYEQQKMRKDVQELKKSFANRIKNINYFIKKILIDKVEVEEHFKRVLQTIENYKNDLLKSSDVDSNFKFANLMKKLEDLSIALAEKNRDFNVLAEFHLNLRKSLEEKEKLIKELQEENKLFYLVPKYNELLEQLDKEEEEEGNSKCVKELKKEFLLMYGRLMMTRKQLEEKEVIETDMRNLNTKIYSELVESITVIKNLESQYKFQEFRMNKEKKKKDEKIKKLLGDKLKLNKVINEMERMLQEANVNADGLKDNIIANYELPELHTDMEDEEDENGAENKENIDKMNSKKTKEETKDKKDANGDIGKAKKKKKKGNNTRSNNVTAPLPYTSGNTSIKKDLQPAESTKSAKLNVNKLNALAKVPVGFNKIISDGIKFSKRKKTMKATFLKKKESKKKIRKLVVETDTSEKKLENKTDSKSSIKKKKMKKNKALTSDSNTEEAKSTKKSTTPQKKKKKKKKKDKKKSELSKKLPNETESENLESSAQLHEDELNGMDSEQSDTHSETNEIREILNLEIEKKKKGESKIIGNLSTKMSSQNTTSTKKNLSMKKE